MYVFCPQLQSEVDNRYLACRASCSRALSMINKFIQNIDKHDVACAEDVVQYVLFGTT